MGGRERSEDLEKGQRQQRKIRWRKRGRGTERKKKEVGERLWWQAMLLYARSTLDSR